MWSIFLAILYGVIGSIVSFKIESSSSLLQHIKRSMLWPYYVIMKKKS